MYFLHSLRWEAQQYEKDKFKTLQYDYVRERDEKMKNKAWANVVNVEWETRYEVNFNNF